MQLEARQSRGFKNNKEYLTLTVFNEPNKEVVGTGGGGACSATLCLTGVAERGVDCVRTRMGAGLLAPAARGLDGVDGL